MDRIEKIRKQEDDFKSKWWKNDYVDYQNSNGSVHVSNVIFSELNDEDLVGLYGWLLLTTDFISVRRVDEIYFKR